MKPTTLPRQIALLFLLAVAAYALSYGCIEHQRSKNGPWQVTFESDAGRPAIVIAQPALGIRDVRIVLAAETATTNPPQRVAFGEVRPVPFVVPFGRCIFQDAQTLPGTVVLELFGHEVQLLPRTLTVDKAERPWRSGETVVLDRPGG
jgi:hypothetical protein